MVNKINLKVAHIGCPYFPYLGGSTKRLSKLAELIYSKEGFQQYLVTPSLSRDCSKDDLYFYEVLRNEKVNNFGFIYDIFNFIKKNDIDIVVFHNSRVLLNWFLFYHFRLPHVKILVEIHSFRDDSKFKKIVNSFLYKKSDGVVHLSRSSEDYMARNYFNNNNHVIYNGINVVGTGNKTSNYNPDKIRLCYVGSFHDWQGVNIICENILSLGSDYWLNNEIYLIGDGPELNLIRNKLSPFVNKGAKVFIVGWKDSVYIESIIKDTDYLLSTRPSTTATETVFPLKIVDSVNYNVPLLCTDVGGLKEILHEKNAAFYIDKTNLYSMAAFLRNPPDKKCYNKVKSNLLDLKDSLDTWHYSAEKYLSLFKEVCSDIKK
ncbi:MULTISPECIES: glycosyltransferase family 4 protein [unclassified Pseudoalteromonas]|uniref:glycosyltransferase family 4 protein n=1 Tax=unclassified Pseudoalteromonas TaxID=194690 RepID=UPI001108387F|nr:MULTISPECIES: glycosyltransferase family 4 protein [unclassified Pseudoalteromonas]TMN77039.1 hypothetical protein CWB64_17885 [Pseudoalteromonas sp. S410]TMN87480.1 hypothetical protein CWB62_18150 [Pseudoalteromonas sp. S408]TMN94509.1 hypothetical protein CWB61_17990 [Pseudoalteromonas sp. S407]TMO01735.1 hypothetical protein CWB63_03590 [Pseudoalteromonas sp. S409]TMO10884.1 hypothetical protein CWB57_09590 [Pseudoalteromonas sp. S186]